MTEPIRTEAPDAGFTLLELLIVMTILGMLGVLGTIQLVGYLEWARVDTAKLQLDQLTTSLDLFRVDVGRLPTSEEGLKALLELPSNAARWRGPYLRKAEAIVDPWGRPFIYRQPGERRDYDLVSFGADGRPGGTGQDRDISNAP
jgi:general secretion pathway protein G